LSKQGKKPLSDHRRRGKVFSPPMAQIGMSEVSWIDDFLPEFLWLGLILDRHGVHRAFRIIEAVVEAKPTMDSDHSGWLSRTSTWAGLIPEGDDPFRERLAASGHLDALRQAISPLAQHYPECPLRCFFGGADIEGSLETVRESVAETLNRWDEHATWIQLAAVYMVIGQGKLHFPADSVLARFPEIEHYPETEISKKIASACRALINSFPQSEFGPAVEVWPTYFWRRGLELDACVPAYEVSRHE
jgi:hypothetical protein